MDRRPATVSRNDNIVALQTTVVNFFVLPGVSLEFLSSPGEELFVSHLICQNKSFLKQSSDGNSVVRYFVLQGFDFVRHDIFDSCCLW